MDRSNNIFKQINSNLTNKYICYNCNLKGISFITLNYSHNRLYPAWSILRLFYVDPISCGSSTLLHYHVSHTIETLLWQTKLKVSIYWKGNLTISYLIQKCITHHFMKLPLAMVKAELHTRRIVVSCWCNWKQTIV